MIDYFKVYECQKTVEANQSLLAGFKNFNVKQYFSELDSNKNGFLTIDELVNLQSDEVQDWEQ